MTSSARRGAVLRADGICFAYGPDAEPVLSDIDVAPAAGAMTALTGPSGRGKSTLLFVLGLLVRPSSGQVFVDGSDTAAMTDAARSRLRATTIGFVFQDAALDASTSVLSNVVESCDYTGRPRREAIDRAGLLLAEMGVTVPGRRRPLQISGGQAQRSGALLPGPGIILADESTGCRRPR